MRSAVCWTTVRRSQVDAPRQRGHTALIENRWQGGCMLISRGWVSQGVCQGRLRGAPQGAQETIGQPRMPDPVVLRALQ